MNLGVASVAEQDQVGDVGVTVVEPMLGVMSLSPHRRDSAPRSTASTSHASGEDLVVAKDPLAAAKEERDAGLVKDRWDNFGVT